MAAPVTTGTTVIKDTSDLCVGIAPPPHDDNYVKIEEIDKLPHFWQEDIYNYMSTTPEVGFPYAPGRRIIVGHYTFPVNDLLQHARLLHNHNVLIIPRTDPNRRVVGTRHNIYYIVFDHILKYMLIYDDRGIAHPYIPTLICKKDEFDKYRDHAEKYKNMLNTLKTFGTPTDIPILLPTGDHKYRQYTVHNITGKLTEVTKMNEKIKEMFKDTGKVWAGVVEDDTLQIYAYKDTNAGVMILHIQHPIDPKVLYTGVVALTEEGARKAYQTYFDIKKGTLTVTTYIANRPTESSWGRIARRPIDP